MRESASDAAENGFRKAEHTFIVCEHFRKPFSVADGVLSRKFLRFSPRIIVGSGLTMVVRSLLRDRREG
jgi:hypothetical protein